MKVILASTSPRRKEILSKTDLEFETCPADYEEDMSLDLDPTSLARHLSLGKAQSIASRYKDALIISADTFIVFENQKLGKPHTAENARLMLGMLSGKQHSVITGFAIIDTSTGKIHSDTEETKIHFKNLDRDFVEEYIASGRPLDKAGSYGIQEVGDRFIDKIEGDYFNVMGLPLQKILRVLKGEFGVEANSVV